MFSAGESPAPKGEGDANCARMETDHQNEAGKSRGNQRSR